MLTTVLTASLLALLGSAACSAMGADDWKRYANARFGTSAEYPANLFLPGEPPENGDGLTFEAKDGTAEFKVYGSHGPSVVTDSFPEYRDWLTKHEIGEGLKVSYRAGGKDWFAISGENRGRIIYIKVVGGCPNLSMAHHLRIEYPASDKALYDPVVARAARSLKAGGCRDDQR